MGKAFGTGLELHENLGIGWRVSYEYLESSTEMNPIYLRAFLLDRG